MLKADALCFADVPACDPEELAAVTSNAEVSENQKDHPFLASKYGHLY